MGFSAKQVKALRRNPDHRHVRTREAHGRELAYLEGWYAISQANRIFGFDGWSRETTKSRCALARETRGIFLAVYIARVRLTVQAEGATIIREGHGTGEGRGTLPGEVHDIALKAAETDATKRALATSGRPFGLELYRGGKAAPVAAAQRPLPAPASSPSSVPVSSVIIPVGADARVGFHPDDTTPIPRPSRYYGRRQNVLAEHFRGERRKAERAMGTPISPPAQATSLPAPPLAPVAEPPLLLPSRIDKSQLTLAEPRRLRDKAHLKFVAAQPCLICGRQPSDPHHLRFAQARAIGLKVSDEFTVPLCRGHHRQLHQAGNEVAWWEKLNLKPLEVAQALWEDTRPKAQALAMAQPLSQGTAGAEEAGTAAAAEGADVAAGDVGSFAGSAAATAGSAGATAENVETKPIAPAAPPR
jgi:Rad52/22 family double-strand break repair protein